MEEKVNYVKDHELKIVGVDIETEKNSNKVRRIRFVTDEKDITYKPETSTEEFRNGMTIKGTRQITIDEIPQKVKDIALRVHKNKECPMKLEYSLFDSEDKEGNPVTYRFISYPSQLERWQIL